MVLFGLVYRAYPRAAADKLATVQFWTANIGAPVFFAGIWLSVAGGTRNLGHTGSILVIISLVLFLVIMLRARRA